MQCQGIKEKQMLDALWTVNNKSGIWARLLRSGNSPELTTNGVFKLNTMFYLPAACLPHRLGRDINHLQKSRPYT